MTFAERLRLVVVTDPRPRAPRTMLDVVREAVAAGAPCVQLRDKRAGARDLAEAARALRSITSEAGALLVVNDRFDVALAAGADGVHLGPDDLPVEAVRTAAPHGFLIGASADDPEAAARLVAAGADYIGCGDVFGSTSKADAGDVIGIEGLKRVIGAVDVPVVAIGGITAEGAERVARETNAAGVAAIAAVSSAVDVAGAVRALLRPWSPPHR